MNDHPEIANRVSSYLRDRRQYEIAAIDIAARAGGLPSASAEREIQRLYDEFQRRHRSTVSMRDMHGFEVADPPSVDPDTAQIVSVTLQGERAIVATLEDLDRDAGLPQGRFEYILVFEGDWKLLDRRMIIDDGSRHEVIEGLL